MQENLFNNHLFQLYVKIVGEGPQEMFAILDAGSVANSSDFTFDFSYMTIIKMKAKSKAKAQFGILKNSIFISY